MSSCDRCGVGLPHTAQERTNCIAAGAASAQADASERIANALEKISVQLGDIVAILSNLSEQGTPKEPPK